MPTYNNAWPLRFLAISRGESERADFLRILCESWPESPPTNRSWRIRPRRRRRPRRAAGRDILAACALLQAGEDAPERAGAGESMGNEVIGRLCENKSSTRLDFGLEFSKAACGRNRRGADRAPPSRRQAADIAEAVADRRSRSGKQGA